MSRPAQLDKQIARVKELQEEFYGDKPEGTATAETPQSPPKEGTPPQPVVESPVTISKEEYDRLEQEYRTVEQRYRTLQGMHNAEGTRLRQELMAKEAAIQDMQNRLTALEQTKQVASTPAKYVTDEDVSEYGETLEMVRRAAREEAENLFAQQEGKHLARIAELEAQLGQVRSTVVPAVETITRNQTEQIKNDFWAAINTQVPDWRTVNDNPDFKAWLLAEDPLTGANRQQFLSQARDEYDAPRVIRFFTEWKRIAAGGQTPAPRTNTQAELEAMVSPGAVRNGTPVVPSKKQWTHQEIGKFFNDVNRGVYANRLEEKRQIEADIFLAQKERRVV